MTYQDKVVLGFEIILLGFIAYYTLQEFHEILQSGFFTYFSEGWNYVDWANLAIFFTVIGLRVSSLATISKFSLESTSITYIDLPAIGVYATQELNVNAINFFLMYFKFFKYLR